LPKTSPWMNTEEKESKASSLLLKDPWADVNSSFVIFMSWLESYERKSMSSEESWLVLMASEMFAYVRLIRETSEEKSWQGKHRRIRRLGFPRSTTQWLLYSQTTNEIKTLIYIINLIEKRLDEAEASEKIITIHYWKLPCELYISWTRNSFLLRHYATTNMIQLLDSSISPKDFIIAATPL